jgi:hypothetical protein
MVGVGAAARARLEGSIAFLAQLPQYRAHFERMGVSPIDTRLAADDAQELGERLAAWRGVVDELVVIAVPPPDRPEEVLELLETVRGVWH